MKTSKLMLSLVMLVALFTTRSAAQILLPEIKIIAASYKYLNAVNNEELAQPVKMLQMHAATYNVKTSEFYEDDYDTYFISFYIPDGSILATYDKDGKLMRTAEKYKDIKLPKAVREAVVSRFPNWIISKNVYRVSYYDANGEATKDYKLLLENGDKRMNVKLDENGKFL